MNGVDRIKNAVNAVVHFLEKRKESVVRAREKYPRVGPPTVGHAVRLGSITVVSRKQLLFIFRIVAFTGLFGVLALAQQYRIISADYGYGRDRVDVTQRLRDLARTNATFRMGNSTFGMDPAPGRVKTLRIQTTGPGGRPRTFEYREGSVINGADFSGWGGGQWGKQPEFVILRAWYGVPGRNVDVTQRLRDLAARNAFFRMGNSTFGIDPAHGVVKTLRIWARGPNGSPRSFDYREGSIVDGSMFSGWGGGSWGATSWNGGWDGRPVAR